MPLWRWPWAPILKLMMSVVRQPHVHSACCASRSSARQTKHHDSNESFPSHCQDAPGGHEAHVTPAKDKSSICSCCYYVSRGSFQKVRITDLRGAMDQHASICEKLLVGSHLSLSLLFRGLRSSEGTSSSTLCCFLRSALATRE